MRKLKKALSAALALAVSLALAVPAFAEGSTWNLSVQGKTNEETALPTATYTLRDWMVDYPDDDRVTTLVGTRSVEVDNLIGLARGDTIAITANPAGRIDVQAFSDPDGDGVYDQHMLVVDPLDLNFEYKDFPLPYEDGAVLHDIEGMMLCPVLGLTNEGVFGEGIQTHLGLGYEGQENEWIGITVSADYLFQCFGPNTILAFVTMDDELGWEGDKGWNVFLMDDRQPTAPVEPEQPSEPSAPTTPPAGKVMLSPQSLTVDGEAVECEKYNIDDRNYFKLRDLASLLSGTGSQFEVGYDEDTATVSITTGQAYTPIGTELAAGVDNSASVQPSSQSILIDGEKCDTLTVYNIGGSNFFQLRELGNILGFEVDFDGDTNTAIVRSAEK